MTGPESFPLSKALGPSPSSCAPLSMASSPAQPLRNVNPFLGPDCSRQNFPVWEEAMASHRLRKQRLAEQKCDWEEEETDYAEGGPGYAASWLSTGAAYGANPERQPDNDDGDSLEDEEGQGEAGELDIDTIAHLRWQKFQLPADPAAAMYNPLAPVDNVPLHWLLEDTRRAEAFFDRAPDFLSRPGLTAPGVCWDRGLLDDEGEEEQEEDVQAAVALGHSSGSRSCRSASKRAAAAASAAVAEAEMAAALALLRQEQEQQEQEQQQQQELHQHSLLQEYLHTAHSSSSGGAAGLRRGSQEVEAWCQQHNFQQQQLLEGREASDANTTTSGSSCGSTSTPQRRTGSSRRRAAREAMQGGKAGSPSHSCWSEGALSEAVSEAVSGCEGRAGDEAHHEGPGCSPAASDCCPSTGRGSIRRGGRARRAGCCGAGGAGSGASVNLWEASPMLSPFSSMQQILDTPQAVRYDYAARAKAMAEAAATAEGAAGEGKQQQQQVEEEQSQQRFATVAPGPSTAENSCAGQQEEHVLMEQDSLEMAEHDQEVMDGPSDAQSGQHQQLKQLKQHQQHQQHTENSHSLPVLVSGIASQQRHSSLAPVAVESSRCQGSYKPPLSSRRALLQMEMEEERQQTALAGHQHNVKEDREFSFFRPGSAVQAELMALGEEMQQEETEQEQQAVGRGLQQRLSPPSLPLSAVSAPTLPSSTFMTSSSAAEAFSAFGPLPIAAALPSFTGFTGSRSKWLQIGQTSSVSPMLGSSTAGSTAFQPISSFARERSDLTGSYLGASRATLFSEYSPLQDAASSSSSNSFAASRLTVAGLADSALSTHAVPIAAAAPSLAAGGQASKQEEEDATVGSFRAAKRTLRGERLAFSGLFEKEEEGGLAPAAGAAVARHGGMREGAGRVAGDGALQLSDLLGPSWEQSTKSGKPSSGFLPSVGTLPSFASAAAASGFPEGPPSVPFSTFATTRATGAAAAMTAGVLSPQAPTLWNKQVPASAAALEDQSLAGKPAATGSHSGTVAVLL